MKLKGVSFILIIMKGDVDEIVKNLREMRAYMANDPSLDDISEKFSTLKNECPHLFALMLENKQGHFEDLVALISKAKDIKDGRISMLNATKIVKNRFDNKYIYPFIERDNLTEEQKKETEEYIRKEKIEADNLEESLSKRQSITIFLYLKKTKYKKINYYDQY